VSETVIEYIAEIGLYAPPAVQANGFLNVSVIFSSAATGNRCSATASP
jgi:hypothetical protein